MGAFADASELAVTNTRGIVRISPSNVSGLVAGTSHQAGYPADVGYPIFWLDCADTNGWTIAADGGVSRIPSRTGERFLTTTKGDVSGFSWTPNCPVFEADEASLGASALDFGVKGSQRALMFDAVGPDGLTTNMLDGIGTIVAVYYTAKGSGANGEGGYYGGGLLGGGFGSHGADNNNRSGYVLYRASTDKRRTSSENSGDIGRQRYYENPIANISHTHYAIQSGTIRQEGQVTQPAQVGFSGGWEIFSLVPDATYGLFNATGFGMNYTDVKDVSGGFKVAEYLIYGRKLSDEETMRVEDYLRKKWFPSRTARGRNGDVRASWLRISKNASGNQAGVEMPVNVPAGEKLTIGRLTGGNGSTEAAIVKTGDGTLEIQEAANYNGVVKMNGGTLAFSRRPVPEELPRDAVLHFDASAPDSVVTNESGKVTLWRNLTDEVFRRETIRGARPRADANAPTLLPDELGKGMDVLDFGDWNSGECLNLSTNETEETVKTDVAVQGPVTLVAVVGAQRGGGRAIVGGGDNSAFDRHSAIPGHFTQQLIGGYSYRNSIAASTYNTAFVDGKEVNCAADRQGYLTPGYQVVAIRAPGSIDITKIGAGSNGAGGLRLAELAVWRRVLSDDEMRDASAMLMNKWLKREAPGYARFRTDGVADIQKVTAVADTVIDVPEGTARIGTLASAGGRIVKTGAGTLEVQELSTDGIAVAGGNLVQVAKPDVCADHKLDDSSWLAAAPSLHLDAADQSSMMIREVNGERRVVAWHSDDKGVLATSPYGSSGASVYDYSMDAKAPYLSSEATLNGYETVDFGPFTTAAGGRYMMLSRSFDSVRHAFAVWTPRDDTRGTLLGISNLNIDGANNELYNFLRTSTDPSQILAANGTTDVVSGGKICTNGVEVTRAAVPKAGEFTLTEFHTAGGAHVSALARGQNSDAQVGGLRLAEIVIYERVLTEREKLATRNYLMKKWFDREPETLPEVESPSASVTEITVDGETGLRVDGSVAATRIVGEGTFVKTGEGTLSIVGMNGFTGTVSVAEGTFGISGKRLPATGALVTDGLLFRVDATGGLSTTTNSDGTVSVDRWESTLGDGWTAEPYDTAKKPTVVPDNDLGGAQTVRMAPTQAMKFKLNGSDAVLDGMHTVFWVLGSQEGGGFLLGGGTNWVDSAHRYNFMRGRVGHSSQYFLSTDTILDGVSYWTIPDTIRQADWRIDGTNITVTKTGLSGAWDLRVRF